MRTAFTLVEMLVVTAIISVLMAIGFAVPWSVERQGLVRESAEELASTLRETRTRAMRENRTFAVSFNIENAPGSSGRVLNNRSGGHWYRVLGPKDAAFHPGSDATTARLPPIFRKDANSLNGSGCPWTWNSNPLRHQLDLVNRCWVDEPHVLAKGKVRFLALTDQDNGDNCDSNGGGFYAATYPRPWFGWWDQNSKNLYAWGGYTPEITMLYQGIQLGRYGPIKANGRWASQSGFFYEGFDGAITGCVNPSDRQVVDDANNDGQVLDPEYNAPTYWTLWKQGEPRPLLNAAWLDFAFLFHPDGSVSTLWFNLRREYFEASLGVTNYAFCGASYSSQRVFTWDGKGRKDINAVQDRTYGNLEPEASDFSARTGFFYITLAPDAKDDATAFPTAQDALRTLTPMYRVGISRHGQVVVVPVRSTPGGYAGRTFDGSITGNDWQVRTKLWGVASNRVNWGDEYANGARWGNPDVRIAPNYYGRTLQEKDDAPRGMPVTDVVTAEMLAERKWWWAP